MPELNNCPDIVKPVRLSCHCGSFRQAERVVTQLYEKFLKPSGVTITQLSILKIVTARPGVTTGQLANALVMDSTTLTRTLRIIQNNNWIFAGENEDRRKRHWTTTESGQQKLQEAIPLWMSAQNELTRLSRDVDLDALGSTMFNVVLQMSK